MPPSAPCPSVNPSTLNPSYPSYTKPSSQATSLLPSTSLPSHRVSRLPPPAPNISKFDSLFGKRLLKFQYELSRLRLSISSTVLRLLSSCSDSSGLLAPPVEGQSFILSFLCHPSFLSFIILSSCPFAFGPPLPPGHLRLRATFAFGPPLPTGHLRLRATFASGPPSPSGNLCRRATFADGPPSALTFLLFFFFSLFSFQTALAIGLYLYFRVSNTYPANLYRHRISASNSRLTRPLTTPTSCATAALTCTMHYLRTNHLLYLSDQNSNQSQLLNCSSSIIHYGIE